MYYRDRLQRRRTYRRRDPFTQSADAAQALAVLRERGPRTDDPAVYQRWIDVLTHRASERTASLQSAAATMTPPMTKEAFAGVLRRAHRAAGVPITQTPYRATEDSRP